MDTTGDLQTPFDWRGRSPIKLTRSSSYYGKVGLCIHTHKFSHKNLLKKKAAPTTHLDSQFWTILSPCSYRPFDALTLSINLTMLLSLHE